MLLLSNKDVYAACNPEDIIVSVEEAFRHLESGDYLMPDRLHLNIGNNTLLVMPSAADGLFCTKLVTINPLNAKTYKPIINGTVQLTDQDTGSVLSFLDGGAVTAIRTGAVGAVAAKYLHPKDHASIGLIGTGVQGLHLLWMISTVKTVDTFYLFNYKSRQTEVFINQLQKKIPQANLMVVERKEELIKNSDIIVTATTSASPVLPDIPELLEEKLYVCIGSYRTDMGELPRKIYSIIDNMYIDIHYAMKESGDVSWALKNGLLLESDIVPLSKLITGAHRPIDRTRVFKSVGMALFDLTVSKEIFRTAKKKKIGTELN